MEISGFLKYSLWSPVEKKGIWKDMALYGIAQIVITLVTIAVVIGLALVPFMSIKSGALSGTSLVLLIAGAIVLFAIYYIIGLYFTGKFYSFALNDLKLTPSLAQVNSSYIVRLFVTGFEVFFHNLLFWRKKILLLTYAPIILGFIAAYLKMPVVSVILIGIGFVAWLIAEIYHGIRLMLLVPVAMANPEFGYGQASVEAWGMVGNENVLRLIAYGIGLAVIATIIWAVVYVITMVAAYTVCLYPIALLIQVIFSVYIAYASIAALAYIYAGLKEEKEGPAEKSVAQAEIKPFEMPAQEPEAEPKAFVMPIEAPKKAAKKPAAKAKKKAVKKKR